MLVVYLTNLRVKMKIKFSVSLKRKHWAWYSLLCNEKVVKVGQEICNNF